MAEAQFQPAKVLAASFLGAILVGALLLSLPFSTTAGRIDPVDALFTSASAVCVTGLTVKDTPKDFTAAGQAVILILIQLGGLGIMTFSTLILIAAGRKISIRDRLLIQSAFQPGIPLDFKSMLKSIFAFTFILEACGAAALLPAFLSGHGGFRAVWLSVFHSVSAFCNAGFALFSDSLASFRGRLDVNLTVITLIILGGLGFPVLNELRLVARSRLAGREARPSLHLKIVLAATGVLILAAFAFIFLYESSRSMSAYGGRERFLASLFQAVTPRTAGFNTIDLNLLAPASVLLIMMLMFVGASPASTGGGIKTTTASVLFLYLRARLAARDSTDAFKRSLTATAVTNALTLVALALAVIFLAWVGLLLAQPTLGMKEALFEAYSAFGTVGLSLGITPRLTTAGKFIIILTMFVGRVGPLTTLYALSNPERLRRYHYAEENVLIG